MEGWESNLGRSKGIEAKAITCTYRPCSAGRIPVSKSERLFIGRFLRATISRKGSRTFIEKWKYI